MCADVGELLAAIKVVAEARKGEILTLAEQKTAEISERAEAQIEQLREEAFACLEGQLRMQSECIVGRTELEIRDRIVHLKNQALQEVFERAGEQIAELQNTETYKGVLMRLIREAIGRINCENTRLVLSRADLEVWQTLKEGFGPSVSVVFHDGPKGTVIVETDDRSQSIDNSIATRLETAAEVMRRELVEVLFESDISAENGE